MTALSLDITSDGPSRITIAVSGEIDLSNASQLDDCLGAHVDDDITVDLENCGFLGTSGLSALIRAYNASRAAGNTLRTTGEPDHILKVIEIAGLADILHGEEPAEP